ncbi:hypothetical protein C4566_03630 [Candidatus Parcubacteria bacterium]|nr:MAG: hypothetical protein C4566_03630 [Candidatus Parcubacteria bacterium]
MLDTFLFLFYLIDPLVSLRWCIKLSKTLRPSKLGQINKGTKSTSFRGSPLEDYNRIPLIEMILFLSFFCFYFFKLLILLQPKGQKPQQHTGQKLPSSRLI